MSRTKSLFGRVPVLLSLEERGWALAFEFSQVFQVGDAVVGLEELEFFTGRKIVALPAAVELLFSRTVSDSAVGRAAVAPTGLRAAQLHHRAQQAVALVVVLEFFEVGDLCHHLRHFVEAVSPELFSQVSGQICHRLRLTDAIPAIQPAIAD
jgi:hypothetical protein